MAEERTEQATPRRREEARKRGEVPRSQELAGAAALIGALLGLRLGWRAMLRALVETARTALDPPACDALSIDACCGLARFALGRAASIILPVAMAAALGAAAVNLLQGGMVFSGRPLLPKWDRISILGGLRRIFSRRGCFAVFRSLVKLAVVMLVTYSYLRARWEGVLGLGMQGPVRAAGHFGALVWGLLVRVAGAFLVVAAADYVFQRREHEKNLRMTRYELKEEHKRTEGDPLVRSRIRERQRAMSRHRMMQAVKTATVVVTNPVEVAVALRYEPRRTPAPVVAAKGRRLLAARIRAEAERHGVPIVPSPPLARALYRSVPLGRQIPPELYEAVAEIIAFVYRLAGRGEGE